MAADLRFGGHRGVNVGAGSARTDVVSLGQVQDGGFLWAGTSTGASSNALAVTPTPAVSAYVSGLKIRFVAHLDNTSSSGMTINVNGLGAVALEEYVGQAPEARAVRAGALIEAVYVPTTPGFVITSGLRPQVPLPRGFIDGFEMSNAADADHDIEVGPGACRNHSDVNNIVLPTAIVKRFDAPWAEGTNQGGMQAGSALANNIWLRIYAIFERSTGVVDIMAVPDGTSIILPGSYSHRRQIGWARTDGSANIVSFVWRPGGESRYITAPAALDVNEAIGTAPVARALSAPPNTWALINVHVVSGAGGSGTDNQESRVYVRPTGIDVGTAASGSAPPLASIQHRFNSGGGFAQTEVGAEMRVWVDDNSEVLISCSASRTVRIATLGWIDSRGKDV